MLVGKVSLFLITNNNSEKIYHCNVAIYLYFLFLPAVSPGYSTDGSARRAIIQLKRHLSSILQCLCVSIFYSYRNVNALLSDQLQKADHSFFHFLPSSIFKKGEGIS